MFRVLNVGLQGQSILPVGDERIVYTDNDESSSALRSPYDFQLFVEVVSTPAATRKVGFGYRSHRLIPMRQP